MNRFGDFRPPASGRYAPDERAVLDRPVDVEAMVAGAGYPGAGDRGAPAYSSSMMTLGDASTRLLGPQFQPHVYTFKRGFPMN